MSDTKPLTPHLDLVTVPADLKSFSKEDLKAVSDELRAEVIHTVSKTGGHLGAGLGVIELTVALHHVFDTPKDKLIWDVGHQSYPHKILTGRRDQMHTLRQPGGLYGFPKRSESPYDAFGTAHSSTSISAALGMAVARDQKGQDHHVIAVIGDGAMSAGMAYEAMNNAGALDSRLIVILNDNDMSIAPSTGAMSAYLSRLLSSRSYQSFRDMGRHLVRQFPKPFENAFKRAEEYMRGFITGGTLFEELGFFYVGPVDGHNIDHLIPVLTNLRDNDYAGPVLLHVVTEKGRGFKAAESSPEKGHGVGKYDPLTGKAEPGPKLESYSSCFGKTLTAMANDDPKILAITAAMPSGTGLTSFQQAHPDRFYDVGIAEQHAVTFAAGLAAEGLKPFAAIYSTFLQRAYDQVVHDVALQSLPVRFALDRAGLVGADGATHAGTFDLTYLATLPNFVVMAPADAAEMQRMMVTALEIDDRPSAFRFPRADVNEPLSFDTIQSLKIGKGRILQEGQTVCFLNVGTRLTECLAAAARLKDQGINVTVADARFVKPMDTELVDTLATTHQVFITIEEGSIGGFGSHVAQYLASKGYFDQGLTFRSLFIPDRFVDHGTMAGQYHDCGLDADALVTLTLSLAPRPALKAVARG